jgi:hypothetical protein
LSNSFTLTCLLVNSVGKPPSCRCVVALETVEANVDSFNSRHVPTRFIFESSLRLNRLRNIDFRERWHPPCSSALEGQILPHAFWEYRLHA